MSRRGEKGRWTGLIAAGAIAGAGVAIHHNSEKPIDDPEFYKLRNPPENLQETRVAYFPGLLDWETRAAEENVEIKLTAQHLKGMGSIRFLNFMMEDFLPARMNGDGTEGTVTVKVEGVGDLFIPAESDHNSARRDIINFFCDHRTEFMLTNSHIAELNGMPKQPEMER